jgi:tetratricopeptide (TPR) repeat protein
VERAEQQLRQGDAKGAMPYLEEALQIDPAFADVLSNKATAALQEGNLERAIPQYQLALLMAPGHPGIQMNLALALGAGGRTQEALAVARAAQQSSPKDGNLTRLIERLEAAQGQGKSTVSAQP